MSNHTHNTLFKRLHLTNDLTIRLANAADIPKLEWMGEYTHFRHMFQTTYEEQNTTGRRLILVADFNGFPIGHVFMLVRNTGFWNADRGYLYSFRVMEPFRGLKIGTLLIRESEKIMRDHRLKYVIIAVAKDNVGARRLYEREGYTVYDDDEGRWSYKDHNGKIVHVHEPCWMLEKKL